MGPKPLRYLPALIALTAACAALLMLGIVTPFYRGGSYGSVEALISDTGVAWPFLLMVGLIGVGIADVARGSATGAGVAVGVCLSLSGTVGSIVRSFSDTDMGIGAGTLAWCLAMVVAVALFVLLLLAKRPGTRPGTAPYGLGIALGVAAILWVVAYVLPGPGSDVSALENLNFHDNVQTALAVVPPVVVFAAFVVAAVRSTAAATGIALGSAMSYLAISVQSTLKFGSISTFGQAAAYIWFALAAATIVAVLAAVNALLVRSGTLDPRVAAAPGMAPTGPPRRVLPIVSVVALAATLVLTTTAIINRAEPDAPYDYYDAMGDSYDDEGSYDDYGGYDEYDYGYDGAASSGSYVPDDSSIPSGSGSAVPVSSCPASDTQPELQRYWEDSQRRIHLVIVITTDCDSNQVVNDSNARFGLWASSTSFTQGSFDFSANPVAVPAHGRSAEVELVFERGSATFNEASLGRISFPAESAPATSGIDIRYIFRCEPDDTGAGGSSATSMTSNGPADLAMSGDDAALSEPNAPGTLPTVGSLTGDRALAELQRISAADRAYVEGALFDRWVPQLSSKTIGIYDDYSKTTYRDYGQILDHYLELKLRYPDLRLLNSSTYSSFKLKDYWIVIDADPFNTPEEANGWCDAEGIAPTECYAKRINNGEYKGNTRTRAGG